MKPEKRSYRCKGLETAKFDHRREAYYEALQVLVKHAGDPANLLHHFPAFCGHVTLARILCLYEVYKMTLGQSGHIAEAGIFKGTSVLQFAKMMQLFEPESLSLVFGFDWFRGNHPEGAESELVEDGSYFASYEDVQQLVSLQKLDPIIRLVNLDLASEDLSLFMQENQHLHFKIVMLDCGLYEVVRNCISELWPRLNKGGILLLDNFNHETAPGEARAVRELLPDAKVLTFPFCAQPSAYIVK
jgi:hypothetical protein